MKIAAAQIDYRTQHTYSQRTEIRERFSLTRFEPDKVEGQPVETTSGVDRVEANSESSKQHALKVEILLALLEKLTGKKFKTFSADEFQRKLDETQQSFTNANSRLLSPDQTKRPNFSLEYEYNESYQESERTQFDARGTVQTSDGRSISFSVSLNMSRDFLMSNQLSVRAGRAAVEDPLVINFGGKAAELTERTFKFDLNADGTVDNISTLKPGSGYLAIDRNGDGTINNGTELFGPRTGNGFSELAAYDQDRNGFIDENDAIYAQLALWTPNDQNRDQLIELKQANVGAIHLAAIETPFALKNQSNQLRGEIVRSGIFLTEDGNVGTVQQIDLSV